jgi:hypothetical protein
MYGFTTTLADTSFDGAVDKTIAALKAEGFDVLSDIDVQRAVKDKLGAEMAGNVKTALTGSLHQVRQVRQPLPGRNTRLTFSERPEFARWQFWLLLRDDRHDEESGARNPSS